MLLHTMYGVLMVMYCARCYPYLSFLPCGGDGVFASPAGDVHSRKAVSSRRGQRQASGGGGDRTGFCAAGSLLYIYIYIY